MHKIMITGLLTVLLFSFVWADSSPVIELIPGTNEVYIKILNKCHLDLESIHGVVEQNDLPEGILALASSQSLDVAAKSKSENGLLLSIKVKENAKPGDYKLPIMLKDQANHVWNFTVAARLDIQKPNKYDLLQNCPNPFNAITRLKYLLANDQEQHTQLQIFDLLGKHIRTLVNKKQPAGTYTVIWDGKDDAGKPAPSGLYFYKLTSGLYVKTKKMLMVQ